MKDSETKRFCPLVFFRLKVGKEAPTSQEFPGKEISKIKEGKDKKITVVLQSIALCLSCLAPALCPSPSLPSPCGKARRPEGDIAAQASDMKGGMLEDDMATLVAHDCGYPLLRYTCRATRVAADFLDFIPFCRCSTGVALHPLKILVSHLPPPVSGGVAPKFGSEKVSRYTGVSQLQLRVSRYTVQLRWQLYSSEMHAPKTGRIELRSTGSVPVTPAPDTWTKACHTHGSK